MMKVCVRKDSVNPTADGTEFCYRRFLDTDSANAILPQEDLFIHAMIKMYKKCINDKTNYKRDTKGIPAGKIFVAVE